MGSIKLGIPSELSGLMQSIGELTVAHGNMEMVQIMCIKILDRLTPDDAVKLWRKIPASQIRKLILEKLKDKTQKAEMENLLSQARSLSEKRNEYLHAFWGKVNNTWKISSNYADWENLPDENVIRCLAGQIMTLTGKINKLRLELCVH